MSSVVNWGILGYARIARMQAIPAILAAGNSRVHAIASRDAGKLAEACAQVPGAIGYNNYAEIIKH